jgi:hypothetical protein
MVQLYNQIRTYFERNGITNAAPTAGQDQTARMGPAEKGVWGR